jgi:hypothetical protein
MEEIMNFNLDQIQHQQYLQNLVLDFVDVIVRDAIRHDETKWKENEYQQFIESRDSLRNSKDGKDSEYQKLLNSTAIQHHITENKHHPEYWTSRKMEMPIEQILLMFFDWASRCIQKGSEMSDFWDYNMQKLQEQPKAKIVVELLRKYFEEKYPMKWKRLD